MLARAKREGWGNAKRAAIATAKTARSAPTEDAAQAVASEAAGRAQRHVARMERLCETVGFHIESLPPARLFESINRLDALDRLARRTHGLDANSGPVIQMLCTGQEPSFATVFHTAGGVEDEGGELEE